MDERTPSLIHSPIHDYLIAKFKNEISPCFAGAREGAA